MYLICPTVDTDRGTCTPAAVVYSRAEPRSRLPSVLVRIIGNRFGSIEIPRPLSKFGIPLVWTLCTFSIVSGKRQVGEVGALSSSDGSSPSYCIRL